MEEQRINKKILYSGIGIALTVVVIIGATLAYFIARTNTDLQSLTTAKMSLDITPKDASLIGENMIPIYDYEIENLAAKKTFTITSTNTIDIAVKIGVQIESISPALAVNDFKWQLYEGSNMSGTKLGEGTFNGVSDGDALMLSSDIFSKPGNEKTYTLYAYVLENEGDQNALQESTFKFKVYAEGLFDRVAATNYSEKNLIYNIIGSNNHSNVGGILNNPLEGTSSVVYNNSNNGISLMSNSATPMANANGYKGLYKTTDNDGVTYYFTGDVGNNYVVFGDYGTSLPYYGGIGAEKYTVNSNETSVVKSGNMYKYLWRIVRINGDGTIRLTLNSLINYNDRKRDQIAGNNSYYWKGWSYNGATTYESSQIDTDLQYWYSNRNLNKSGLVVPSSFCVDTSRNVTGNNLSYTCNNEVTRNIGLLTQADLEYSGISSNKKMINTTNGSYLNFLVTPTLGAGGGLNGESMYTMTLGKDNKWNALHINETCPEGTTLIEGGSHDGQCLKEDGNYSGYIDVHYSSIKEINDSQDSIRIRPVINIKPDALISSGNGTYASPYVIEY